MKLTEHQQEVKELATQLYVRDLSLHKLETIFTPETYIKAAETFISKINSFLIEDTNTKEPTKNPDFNSSDKLFS